MVGLLVATGLLGAVVGRLAVPVAELVPAEGPVPRPARGRPAVTARVRARDVAGAVLTAALFVALTARLADVDRLAAVPAYLGLAAVGVVLAVADLRTHRLPNVWVLPSYPVLGVLLAAAAWWHHDASALLRAAIGAAVLFGVYVLLALVHPSGMGFGDVKLSGLLGAATAFLSWSTWVVGAFAGFLLGALAGVALIASRRGTRKTALPFGPFMVAGAVIGVLAGDAALGAYAHLLGAH